jgi:hypothetical protein
MTRALALVLPLVAASPGFLFDADGAIRGQGKRFAQRVADNLRERIAKKEPEQERELQQTCDMGDVDLVGETADLSCLALNTPEEVCDANAIVKDVAEVVNTFCTASWFSLSPIESGWEAYFNDMLPVDINTVTAIEKFEKHMQKKIDAADEAAKSALTEKQTKKLNRVNKFRKGLMRVANVANKVCTGADYALKVATTIESTCFNQMDVTVFGSALMRFLMYDQPCASMAFGGDAYGSQQQSWCEQADAGNPGINGMSQYQYFTLRPEDQPRMAGIADGTMMCQWNTDENGDNGYCGFNEEAAAIVQQNMVDNNDCRSFRDMVDEYKAQTPDLGMQFTLRSESEKVAHFQVHSPDMPLGGVMDCGDVSIVLIPGSFDTIFDSTYGQFANLEDFFNLEVDEINMGVYDLGKVYLGQAAPRPLQHCLDMFIVDTDIDCPTDWLMGDIMLTKEYNSEDPNMYDESAASGTGLSIFLAVYLLNGGVSLAHP